MTNKYCPRSQAAEDIIDSKACITIFWYAQQSQSELASFTCHYLSTLIWLDLNTLTETYSAAR